MTDKMATFFADMAGCRTQGQVSHLYAKHLADPEMDWGHINTVIMGRWSRTGLLYIKECAWSIAERARNA